MLLSSQTTLIRCYHGMLITARCHSLYAYSRATVKWFLKRGFRSGIGFTRSHLFEESLLKAIVRCSIMLGVRLLRGIGYFLLGLVTFNKTTIVEGLFRICLSVGTIAVFLGVKHNEYNIIHGQ